MNNWIDTQNPNTIAFLIMIISSVVTLITAVIAVYIAFKQISKQFEHKIIYEGWKDFQIKLYEFSRAFSVYRAKIQWLSYLVDNENNTIVNVGDIRQYRQNKWQEITDAFLDLQSKNVDFLQSFEINEVIFLPLVKMKNIFNKECGVKIMKNIMSLWIKYFLK